MITVLTVRGTGEIQGSTGNMLTAVTAALDPACYTTGPQYDISYPASVGPANPNHSLGGPSELTSVGEGLANLVATMRALRGPIAILGYSLGALVVTAFRESQAQGQYSDCPIAWSACVANPRRRAGDSIDPNPYGYGITGQAGPFTDVPHLEAANPADAITSCNPDSPLRGLADGMAAFSFACLGGWSETLVADLLAKRVQPFSLGYWRNPVRTWQLYDEAARNVIGYVSNTTHVAQYVSGGFCQRLAERINSSSVQA
jgi:hypothetical protein